MYCPRQHRGAGRNLYPVCGGVQVTSRRRPSSAASSATRSRLRSAHRQGHPGDCALPAARRPARLWPTPNSATNMIVQVCLGPAPVGLEEAVGAVPRNDHRLRAGSDRAGQFADPLPLLRAASLRAVSRYPCCRQRKSTTAHVGHPMICRGASSSLQRTAPILQPRLLPCSCVICPAAHRASRSLFAPSTYASTIA